MTKGYSFDGSREKSFLSDYQKRNLLLSYRAIRHYHANLNKEVSMEQNEDTRLKEFRQLKNEIRESRDYLVVGIDVAKERHYAFFGTAAGKTLLRKLVFDNTKEGFEKLLFHAATLKTRHALTKAVFGLEPTGDYHKPLGEYLITHDQILVLVAGSAVKKNRELLTGRWDRNDTKDAANIADLVTQGKCLFYEHPAPLVRELRALLSLKRKLKKLEPASMVRIRNHLIAQYFPELDPYYRCTEGPAIVRWCFDPHELASLSFPAFASMVSRRNGGGSQEGRLLEIHTKAAQSIGCALTPAVPFEAQRILTTITQTKAMLKEVDQAIEKVCKGFPEYGCLMSIPGFGPDVSAKVLGALGNPHRFGSGRQVLKLAGLDLSGDKSGKREDTSMVISKKGKADLRYALYQAALVASTGNHRFMHYFTTKLKGREREKGIGTKLRVKLAAKMLIIAWTLMKKGEMFNPGCVDV